MTIEEATALLLASEHCDKGICQDPATYASPTGRLYCDEHKKEADVELDSARETRELLDVVEAGGVVWGLRG